MTKHNWNRIKGYRKSGPQTPVLIQTPNECVIIYERCKFSFVCDLPLDAALTWGSIRGSRVDDRVQPDLPQGFDRLRPLRPPGKGVFAAAKKNAMGVLAKQRADALAAQRQPLLFTESDLPVQIKPPKGVA